MTDLIAILSIGKGTWGHVNSLINGEEWNKIYLLTNDFGKETFKPNEKTELINFDFNSKNLSQEIFEKLKDNVSGEVAINFISGSGKEHMALISALIKLGIGFRLVVSEEGKVKEI
jgi:hypothetical protein